MTYREMLYNGGKIGLCVAGAVLAILVFITTLHAMGWWLGKLHQWLPIQ